MIEPLLILESDGHGISTLTLNRPEKRNALSIALLEEFQSQLKGLSNSSERILILQATGNVFCAGMDLIEAANTQLFDPIAKLIRRHCSLSTAPLSSP